MQQPLQSDQPARQHPTGSETTVQSAHQVHGSTATSGDQQAQLCAALYGQPQASTGQYVQTGISQSPGIPQGIPTFPFVHQHKHLHQLETMEILWTVLLGLMLPSGQLVLEEAAAILMEVESLHSLPLLAPTSNRDRVKRSPYR